VGNNNNYMEHSTSLEAVSCATNKQFSKTLLIPMIHYCFHKCSRLYPTLSYPTLPYPRPPHPISLGFILIFALPSLGLSNDLLFSAKITDTLYGIHLTNMCPTCPALHVLLHSIILDGIFHDSVHQAGFSSNLYFTPLLPVVCLY
jgi:hypothetical protein